MQVCLLSHLSPRVRLCVSLRLEKSNYQITFVIKQRHGFIVAKRASGQQLVVVVVAVLSQTTMNVQILVKSVARQDAFSVCVR